MREYETTFIIQPELSEEGVQAVCGRVEAILDKQGATRLFYDDMGRRRLAYGIRNFQKGHYLTIFYLDDGKVVAELERALRLDDSVLRYLTVLANPEVADIEARKAEGVEIYALPDAEYAKVRDMTIEKVWPQFVGKEGMSQEKIDLIKQEAGPVGDGGWGYTR